MVAERRAGRLLSVNVGMPQDVVWHGRTVHTAAWKRPVDGQRMVRRLNIGQRMVRRLNLDGDGQGELAGHGGESSPTRSSPTGTGRSSWAETISVWAVRGEFHGGRPGI